MRERNTTTATGKNKKKQIAFSYRWTDGRWTLSDLNLFKFQSQRSLTGSKFKCALTFYSIIWF